MTTFTDVADLLSGARRRDALAAEEFADLLEGGRTQRGGDLAPLVALARALTPAEHVPEPTFRSALRAQLVAEAAARVPAVLVRRAPEHARPSAPRWRAAVAAVAVASAVTGVGAAAASSQALPGDALYGLKLRVETIQLSLADSDLDRGRELLEQAATRIGEAERLAQTGDPSTRDELAETLSRIQRSTAEGAAALLRSYRESGDPEPLQVLAWFAGQEQPRLAELADRLDPAMRAQLLQTIDSLAMAEASARAVLSPTPAGIGEAAGLPGFARDDGEEVPRQAGRGALPPSAANRPAASERLTPAISATTGDRLDATDPAPTVTAVPPVTTAVPPVAASVPTVTTSVPTLRMDPTAAPATEPLPAPSGPQPSVAEAPSVLPLVPPTALPCVPVPAVVSC